MLTLTDKDLWHSACDSAVNKWRSANLEVIFDSVLNSDLEQMFAPVRHLLVKTPEGGLGVMCCVYELLHGGHPMKEIMVPATLQDFVKACVEDRVAMTGGHFAVIKGLEYSRETGYIPENEEEITSFTEYLSNLPDFWEVEVPE